MVTAKDVEPSFKNDADKGERDRHDRRQPKDRRKRIAHSHFCFMHDELRQCPTKTPESGCGEDHDDAGNGDRRGIEDHEKDAKCDESNHAHQAERIRFEFKEERESQNENQG